MTLWFVDDTTNMAIARDAVTLALDPTKDIDLGDGNWLGGLSDGTTLWFINNTTNMAIAYATRPRWR